MVQKKLNVALLEVTSNALAVIYSACRQCYSSNFAGKIFAESIEKKAEHEKFVRHVIASGHASPLEHVKFTFALEGVSRALTHQLVRHRLASYSQQSQRYVRESSFAYIVPPSIDADEEMKREYANIMRAIQDSYNTLLEMFAKKNRQGEDANQDARFVLPQAVETKIVLTMNCRELRHFFEERCCVRAQWEIRALAVEMLMICRRELPVVFDDAGAKCVGLGYCPEGEKFTCGKYPLKEEILGRERHAKQR